MSEIHASYDFTSAPIKYGLDIDRLTSDLALPGFSLSEAAVEVQYIGQRAYRAAGWVQKSIAESDASADDAFNPRDPHKVSAQSKRLEAAKKSGEKVAYWAASANYPGDLDASPAPHGFIKLEQQGWRDKRIQRVAQRAGYTGVYACIHDLNVLPEFEGWGIGTALAHNALLQQPEKLKSSLYTATTNEPMIAWATKYGYRVTDEYEDTTLFNNISVQFYRMQADAVGQVIERMELARPELLTRVPRTNYESLLSKLSGHKGMMF